VVRALAPPGFGIHEHLPDFTEQRHRPVLAAHLNRLGDTVRKPSWSRCGRAAENVEDEPPARFNQLALQNALLLGLTRVGVDIRLGCRPDIEL
jgi:hypothetical protein